MCAGLQRVHVCSPTPHEAGNCHDAMIKLGLAKGGSAPGNVELNRYSNIVPFDSHRVLLSTDRFINATDIKCVSHRICTSFTSPTTCLDGSFRSFVASGVARISHLMPLRPPLFAPCAAVGTILPPAREPVVVRAEEVVEWHGGEPAPLPPCRGCRFSKCRLADKNMRTTA